MSNKELLILIYLYIPEEQTILKYLKNKTTSILIYLYIPEEQTILKVIEFIEFFKRFIGISFEHLKLFSIKT